MFGAHPGALARRVAAALAFDVDDLAAWESAITSHTPEVVRWIEPMLFQALCDAVGVYAVRKLGVQVQWGVSEPDEDGLAPPPVLRVSSAEDPDTGVHIDVGSELLRWCIMPLREGESVPSLTVWCRDRLGPATGR